MHPQRAWLQEKYPKKRFLERFIKGLLGEGSPRAGEDSWVEMKYPGGGDGRQGWHPSEGGCAAAAVLGSVVKI